MNRKTIDLMRVAMNDVVTLTPIMHQLTRYKDVDGILKWLIINKITGHNLKDFLAINHNNSVMGMVKFIIEHRDKLINPNAIILGKDCS